MRKFQSGILILILFCFPYVYFSMYQDFDNRSMLGYLFMIIVTSLLAFFSKRSNNLFFLVLGNILSAIISYIYISDMAGNDRWEGYFKPLAPNDLLILVSLLNLIPQFCAIWLVRNPKNKEQQ